MKSITLFVGALGIHMFAWAYGVSHQASCQTTNPNVGPVSGVFAELSAKEHLFAVDDVFVLQAIYDKNRQLIEIKVVPKYFFHDTHPEWKEPDAPATMTPLRYGEILTKIQEIKPVGQLRERSHFGVTLNLRVNIHDFYDDGVILRATFGFPKGSDSGDVSWFKIFYFREMSGRLEAKAGPTAYGEALDYQVKMNGKWYWTTESSFVSTTVGRFAKIEAAGPVEMNNRLNEGLIRQDSIHAGTQ
jgi:hypothetical protein